MGNSGNKINVKQKKKEKSPAKWIKLCMDAKKRKKTTTIWKRKGYYIILLQDPIRARMYWPMLPTSVGVCVQVCGVYVYYIRQINPFEWGYLKINGGWAGVGK